MQRATQNSASFVRGKMRADADLSKTTWFQVGGKARWLFKPEDKEDLATFMRERDRTMPVTVIGVGSNLLVRDGGVPGVVVRLGRGFTELAVCSSQFAGQKELLPTANCLLLTVGAACLDVHAARFAAEHNVAGLEFLVGIPGTIGGAVAMNAGAYGREIAEVLEQVEIVTCEGEIKILSHAECGFSYRHSSLPEGAIVTRAWLKGVAGEKEKILQKMDEISAARETTQPIRERTGGSTFKNPSGKKAWELIDQAGCRGLKIGGAQVSEQHCNFLINTGNATAQDLEMLGEEVRRRVKEKSGIALEWEIKRIGNV